jgi:hypothetical protein
MQAEDGRTKAQLSQAAQMGVRAMRLGSYAGRKTATSENEG